MKWLLALSITLPTPVLAQSQMEWAEGIGMSSCTTLETLPEGELREWVFGYWTGANLYLGGGDLCSERAHIREFDWPRAYKLLALYCDKVPNSPVMTAAFNVLKELPKVSGSRAASCGE